MSQKAIYIVAPSCSLGMFLICKIPPFHTPTHPLLIYMKFGQLSIDVILSIKNIEWFLILHMLNCINYIRSMNYIFRFFKFFIKKDPSISNTVHGKQVYVHMRYKFMCVGYCGCEYMCVHLWIHVCGVRILYRVIVSVGVYKYVY